MSDMKRNSMQIYYKRKVMVRGGRRGGRREICNFGLKNVKNQKEISHKSFKLQGKLVIMWNQ